MKNELVIVLDFGGQYNQLVARRVRECYVYCEQIIDVLSSYSIIDKKEENLLKAAMEERALDIKGQGRNVLRATLLRNMLLAVFKEIDYEE